MLLRCNIDQGASYISTILARWCYAGAGGCRCHGFSVSLVQVSSA